jgi:hypothetical protein
MTFIHKMQTHITVSIEKEIYDHPAIQAQLNSLNETIKLLRMDDVLDEVIEKPNGTVLGSPDDLKAKNQLGATIGGTKPEDTGAEALKSLIDDVRKDAFQKGCNSVSEKNQMPDLSQMTGLLNTFGPAIANFAANITKNPGAAQTLQETIPVMTTAATNLENK